MSDWSEADIAALSDVSPSDVQEAQAAWRQDAPAPAKGMLDAVQDGESG